MASIPTRDEALALLTEYNQNAGLIKHALAVEGVMRYMARKRGEDEDLWGIVGLIHDLDYEQFADQHCTKTGEILRERGWPEELIRAAVSHGWGICSDVEPQTELEKVLFAIDELTGLVVATALVRPSKSVEGQTLRRRREPRHHPARRRQARRRPLGPHHRRDYGHARRGRRHRPQGRHLGSMHLV